MRTKTISVLGTEYICRYMKFDEEPYFSKQSVSGYCSHSELTIAICDMGTYPGCDTINKDACIRLDKQTMLHELTHAFLNESGLAESSCQYCAGWAKNEEMIDWFALQFHKIEKVANELEQWIDEIHCLTAF